MGRIPKGQYKIDNPEKPATQGAQDEEPPPPKKKPKHNAIYVRHHYAQQR